METRQLIGHAPLTTLAGRVVTTQIVHCVGCDECRGLCRELIELVTLPDSVLKRGPSV